MEAKQPKQTVSKQTETNRNCFETNQNKQKLFQNKSKQTETNRINPKFSEKIPK